jgi:hypothetical protein
MKSIVLILAVGLIGCASNEQSKRPRGPNGTYAYEIKVETSDPGSKIEVNNDYLGEAPLTITVFGDQDGTFHGGMDYEIRALPTKGGQHVQVKRFSGGGWFGREDRIPSRIFFDLNLVPIGNKSTIDVNINN